MKKEKQKKPVRPAPKPAEDVGHLEEQLTDITATAAGKVKKNWKAIAIAVGVVLGAVLVYQSAKSIERGQREGLHACLYELFDAKIAADEEPDEEGLRALLSEIEGKPTEVFVVKQLVRHKLSKADEIERTQREEALAADGPDAEPEAEGKLGLTAETPQQLRESATQLAQGLAERHAASEDVQVWKTGVIEKVAGANSEGWLPKPREYKLPPLPSQ